MLRSLVSLLRHIVDVLGVFVDVADEELRRRSLERSMPAFLALTAPGTPHLHDAGLK